MLRISGVTIPENKRLEIGLTTIYGVGRPRAAATLIGLGIDASKKPSELSPKDESALREAIENSRWKASCVNRSAGISAA